jgi:hypothetical protein
MVLAQLLVKAVAEGGGAMAEKIKITAVAMTGILGLVLLYATIGMLYAAMSMATTMSHLVTVADCYTRVVALRMFELTYRIYSLPL